MRILIAEDDSVSRTIVRKSVKKLGHECLVAQDGLEAWEAYQDAPDIEVIISDWMMPGIEGPELCRRVRALGREGYTFFIFLTALSGKERLLEGIEAGADEYLTKPLDNERLRIALISAARVTSLHKYVHAGTTKDSVTQEDRRTRFSNRQQNLDKNSTAYGLKDRHTGPGARPRRSRLRGGKAWDILLSQGRITEEQLQKALETQKNNRMDLGKTLVSLGYISEEELARAQAQRLGLDYIELDYAMVDRSALTLIPEKMLRKHNVLPLGIEDGLITVALSDPTDIYALEDFQLISGRRVVPVMVAEQNLYRVQNRIFSGSEGMAER